jgi:WD40 repeat protein
MAAGLGDGSIQVWNVRGAWGSRPDLYVQNGHVNGDEISGLCFAADGNMVLSRSTDGTLKVRGLGFGAENVGAFALCLKFDSGVARTGI